MIRKFFVVGLILFYSSVLLAQKAEQPFIKLVNGTKESNNVSASKQFIVGSTCKSCTLTINEKPVKVYNSGGFAYQLALLPGDTTIEIKATNTDKKSISKKISYRLQLPLPDEPVKNISIASIETYPAGNLVLRAGDKISFRVKALPGAAVSIFNKIPLYEMPLSVGNSMAGIYRGEYTVKQTDSFFSYKIPVTLDSNGKKITVETGSRFSVMSPLASDVGITKGRLAHLLFGLGSDRLGGSKIGYIDSSVQLHIIGKVGNDYKVQLAPSLTAYVPDELVSLLPKGTPIPQSLTGQWSVYGDDKFDYVTVNLSNRLPYQSWQQINPHKIIVDVYGATSNTNWITQLQSAKEVADVDYEQVADEIFRIKIQLKNKQHWGHQIFYRGNNLVIKIKQQPADVSLNKLTIAIDAGHGGSNTGAGGPTGSSEKNLALAVSLKLQKALEAQGVKVIMTRTAERIFDNKERILFYRDSLPDLLLSIHLNSSSDPIKSGGTSTHYRHIGYKKLNECINKRMMELGLKQYGVIGSFNFMLNSPTEYPNCLIETLFISNPAEEALMMDEKFQQQMADKIVLGIKDFLAAIP